MVLRQQSGLYIMEEIRLGKLYLLSNMTPIIKKLLQQFNRLEHSAIIWDPPQQILGLPILSQIYGIIINQSAITIKDSLHPILGLLTLSRILSLLTILSQILGKPQIFPLHNLKIHILFQLNNQQVFLILNILSKHRILFLLIIILSIIIILQTKNA